MYDDFLGLNYKTHGKWFDDIQEQHRDIKVQPNTSLYEQLKHFIRNYEKEYSRFIGKSAEQRMHEAALAYYNKMLAGSTSEADRWYAECHIKSHTAMLEVANRRFEEELEAEKKRQPL